MSFIDTSSLVLHVLAATAIIGGGTVQVMAASRVRAATTGDQLVQWAAFTRTGGTVVLGAAIVSLLTGGHLAGAVWGQRGGFELPFITLGIAAWLLLMPVGPMIGGARLRRLVAAAAPLGNGPLSADLRAQAASPATWGPVHSLLGVAAGMVWLMVAKPGWGLGTVGLLVTFAAGWVVGAAVSRSAPNG